LRSVLLTHALSTLSFLEFNPSRIYSLVGVVLSFSKQTAHISPCTVHSSSAYIESTVGLPSASTGVPSNSFYSVGTFQLGIVREEASIVGLPIYGDAEILKSSTNPSAKS